MRIQFGDAVRIVGGFTDPVVAAQRGVGRSKPLIRASQTQPEGWRFLQIYLRLITLTFDLDARIPQELSTPLREISVILTR